ncbi:MAG: transporter [Thermoleophilia bacterium]
MNSVMSAIAASGAPLVATVAGAVAATVRTPSAHLRGGVQHVAAGAVFAAVASELVFELVSARRVWPIVIGFGIGTLLMLVVRQVAERVEASGEGTAAVAGLITAIGVDVFMDGLVLGIGFAAGSRGGLLLTFALTLEMVFLGLTVATALGGERVAAGRVVGTTAAVALLLPVGALLGSTAGHLSHNVVLGLIAFASAALLYLVTEELLVEAHNAPDGPVATGAFFLAFLGDPGAGRGHPPTPRRAGMRPPRTGRRPRVD